MLVHAGACDTFLKNLIIIEYDVSDLRELEPALFKFYENLNWSLHYSKSKGLGEFQTDS